MIILQIDGGASSIKVDGNERKVIEEMAKGSDVPLLLVTLLFIQEALKRDIAILTGKNKNATVTIVENDEVGGDAK